MSNKTTWNIRDECLSITNRLFRYKSKWLGGLAKSALLNLVRVVGTASAVTALIWLWPINLAAGIVACLGLCVLFGWICMKIEGAGD